MNDKTWVNTRKKRGQQQKNLLVKKIFLSAICHATESVEKVKTALSCFVGDLNDPGLKLEINTSKGYFGNPLTLISVETTDNRLMEHVIGKIACSLPKDPNILMKHLDEEGRLHIRFNKQKAFMGEIELGCGDNIVKMEIFFQGTLKDEKIKTFLQELLAGRCRNGVN